MGSNQKIQSGAVLGRLRVDRELTEDSAGETYFGTVDPSGKCAHVRAFAAELTATPGTLESLKAELKRFGAINHSAIGKVVVFNEAPSIGRWLLVTDLGDAVPLADRIKEGDLSAPQAMAFFADLFSALELAHDSHFTHGDLNFSNVAITPANNARVAGFAHFPLSELDRSAKCRKEFQAPELRKGKAEASAATDLYALGIVCFKIMKAIGKRRFPGGVRDVIAKMYEANPEKRYATVREAAADLRRQLPDTGFKRAMAQAERSFTASRALELSLKNQQIEHGRNFWAGFALKMGFVALALALAWPHFREFLAENSRTRNPAASILNRISGGSESPMAEALNARKNTETTMLERQKALEEIFVDDKIDEQAIRRPVPPSPPAAYTPPRQPQPSRTPLRAQSVPDPRIQSVAPSRRPYR